MNAEAAQRAAGTVTELRYAEDVRDGWRIRWRFDDPCPTCSATCRHEVEETIIVKESRPYDGFGVVSMIVVREDGTQLGLQVNPYVLLPCVTDIPT